MTTKDSRYFEEIEDLVSPLILVIVATKMEFTRNEEVCFENCNDDLCGAPGAHGVGSGPAVPN